MCGGQTSLAGLFWLRSVETEKALEELRASPSTLRGEPEGKACRQAYQIGHEIFTACDSIALTLYFFLSELSKNDPLALLVSKHC